MDVLVSVLGVLLELAVLWDVFHRLWHPRGAGTISRIVLSMVWAVTRRIGPRSRQISGPLAIAGAIGTWAALVVLGGALIYWPHLPESFSYDPNLDPGARDPFLDALYLSLVAVATLGFGDIVPTAPWLRLATPLQALIGFALLTAAVSWVLQLYPALSRRRVLSVQLAALRRAGVEDALEQVTPTTAARTLEDLAAGLAQIRVDLTQYAESYYFQEDEPDTSLPANLRYADDLARAGQASASPDVRTAAVVLAGCLDDLAMVLDEEFLHTGSGTTGVLQAYAADHSDLPTP